MKSLSKPMMLLLTLILLISCPTLALAIPGVGPGDLDNDADVDFIDLLLFRSALGTTSGDSGYLPAADYDGDGIISYADLSYSDSTTAIPSAELVGPINDIFVGDTFNVTVVANDVEETNKLLAFGFDLGYDTTAFVYNDETIGSSFLDDSSSFPATDVAASTFPGLSGDGIFLASLNFTSLIPGTFSLGIISSSSDVNEGLTTLYASNIDITQNLDIEVLATPVPEPSTFLLLGGGLAGLAFLVRRRIFT